MASSPPLFTALALCMALAACAPQQADVAPAADPVAAAPARAAPPDKATSARTSAEPQTARQEDGVAALAASLHLRCDTASKGSGCVAGNMDAGDFYDVEVSPSCSADGNFAGVAERDAVLLDALPVTGSKAQVAARLSDGQFVCILATARAGQHVAYYYVVALPPASVGACRGKPICDQYGERPIDFVAQRKQGRHCILTGDARPEGDCAQGWIEPQKLDIFANGL
ncbi:hypothetical protein QE400_000305 [Xanthomonas sacchari]|uniref:hypothetical protein n=1 Tax=Xanthomonas sacchari TaxID=56458 RepID=UPI00277DC972|nr:hypothetical protein [Xanthomonas sacchari]MDQ1090892.1 hypothetical protein [Xanthomonas sacchari]